GLPPEQFDALIAGDVTVGDAVKDLGLEQLLVSVGVRRRRPPMPDPTDHRVIPGTIVSTFPPPSAYSAFNASISSSQQCTRLAGSGTTTVSQMTPICTFPAKLRIEIPIPMSARWGTQNSRLRTRRPAIDSPRWGPGTLVTTAVHLLARKSIKLRLTACGSVINSAL